jgi:hypothetical protein
MFVRLAQGRVDPSKVDEVTAILRETLAVTKQRPGFHPAYMGAHRESGMTMWDTEEHASFTVPPEGAAARLQALGLQAEPPVIFEVTDQI